MKFNQSVSNDSPLKVSSEVFEELEDKTMSWKDGFEEFYLKITKEDKPEWKGYRYATHYNAIENFIQQLLDQRDEEIIGKLKKIRTWKPTKEKQPELIPLDQAISTIKENK